MKTRWIILMGFVLLVGLGCSSNEIKALPQELMGEWETTEPKYDGFTFQLTQEMITFMDAKAENGVEAYMIQKRTKDFDKKAKRDIYTIYYKNKEDLKLQFALSYDPSGGGRVVLKNQTGFFWTRHKDS